MTPPDGLPIGLQLGRTTREVSRAFDQALTRAGGSLPVWLVLLSHHARQGGTQRNLAETIGIKEATLTHHLNAMEAEGLLTRRRDPANRRHHVVALTDDGVRLFERLRDTAYDFNQRLCAGIRPDELQILSDLLDRFRSNTQGD